MATIAEALASAIRSHQAGDRQTAERLYREILKHQPQNIDALHLLGVIAHQVGNQPMAIDLMQQAIAVNPGIATIHMNLGSAYRALGQPVEAEQSYRQAIQLKPDYAAAIANLGVVLRSQGRLTEAIEAYEQALQLDPQSAETYNNLAVALQEQGDSEAAVENYRKALALKPNYGEACSNLAGALLELRRLDEAADCYRQAVSLRPNYFEVYSGLARTLQKLGQYDAATENFRRALELMPDDAELLRQPGSVDLLTKRGRLLQVLGMPDKAVISFQHALDQDPAHIPTLNNLGVARQEQGDTAAAIACYQQVLELQPEHHRAHNNMAAALKSLGQSEQAADCCRRAIELQPDYADAYINLGSVLQEQGLLEQAIESCKRALQLQPDHPDAHCNLAIAYLSQGDFEHGWQEYEWRWRTSEYRPRGFRQPLWEGQSNPNSTILIHTEQGLGDTLQFVRYLSLVKERVGTVLFECQRPLLALLETISGADRLIAMGDDLPDFDAYCSLLSLPRIFQTTCETVPCDVPYLAADPRLVEQWRTRLEELPGLKVGICWQGSTQFKRDRFRSFSVQYFAELARLEGVTLISLQKGFGSEQLADQDQPFPVVDFTDELDEDTGPFLDTAAVIQNLDLVISCDSAIAHLAGGLGVKTWIAEEFTADWRWMWGREDSPWYPTVRLFRQPRPGDWGDVFRRMAITLAKAARPDASGQ